MRILVIEDAKHLAGSVRRGLRAEGFAVDIALDGTDGFWKASECVYDAIVCDIMLQGMSGYRLCSQLHVNGNWTPILMLDEPVRAPRHRDDAPRRLPVDRDGG
jgi:two-component system, OmpR family, response regulator